MVRAGKNLNFHGTNGTGFRRACPMGWRDVSADELVNARVWNFRQRQPPGSGKSTSPITPYPDHSRSVFTAKMWRLSATAKFAVDYGRQGRPWIIHHSSFSFDRCNGCRSVQVDFRGGLSAAKFHPARRRFHESSKCQRCNPVCRLSVRWARRSGARHGWICRRQDGH